jgi:hypothetical protein
MSEEKLAANVPVCVEIDPTVMEFDVTPGAELVAAAAAPAVPADVVTIAATSIVPSNATEVSAFNPCLTRIASPIIGRASPPGCRSL